MKLADKITGIVYSAVLEAWGQYDPTSRMEKAREDVAAELGPVRDAVDKADRFLVCDAKHGFWCESRNDRECNCGLAEAMFGIRSALDMLSEEEL